MKNRYQQAELSSKLKSPHRRIVVLTGARQTGKTTLARKCFSDYAYLSIEDPVMRIHYKSLNASQWNITYPRAILDEVQKEPILVESIKSVYDQYPETEYVLLGSSQILLLDKIKESLAGRCHIAEIFPLTIPELSTSGWNDAVNESFFARFIRQVPELASLPPAFSMLPDYAERQFSFDHYLKYGGYPAVSDNTMSEDIRYEWLENYVRTYLERDVRDLAAIRDLEPFLRIQQLLALQTGQLVNLSSLARDSAVSIKTVQRYIQYLALSYQVITLQPWSKNRMKRLIKSPKIHFLDPGVLRAVIRKRGDFTGNEFESAIVAEIYKQIKLTQLRLYPWHLRTIDGGETDLLLEGESGYFALEIKKTSRVTAKDARYFDKLGTLLDKPLLFSFVLSNDNSVKMLGNTTMALPAAMFLS